MLAPRRLDGDGGRAKVPEVVTTSTDSAASTFSLSRFVEDVRVLVPVAGRALPVEWLPDGRTSLVFRVLEEGRRGDVSVVGPRTRAMFKNATGVVRAVILQFKPGWSAPLLGVAANALTDQIVPLEDLWGRSGGDLCRRAPCCADLPDVLDRLARALAVRTRQTFEPSSARLARHAVRLLEGDEVRVESVAARLGVTARHLRRAFTESVGIGPKEFARTVRLQRAVRMRRRPRTTGRGSPQTRATTIRHTSSPTSGSSSGSRRGLI